MSSADNGSSATIKSGSSASAGELLLCVVAGPLRIRADIGSPTEGRCDELEQFLCMSCVLASRPYVMHL